MKRILLICLSLILLVSVMTSCGQQDDSEKQWKFDYKIEKNVFTKGETIRITVEVTNVGKDYAYIGTLFGPATLYLTADENVTLKTLPFPTPTDVSERIFETGETAQHTYVFYTDEQTFLGAYTMEVPFGTETATFQNLLFTEAPLTEEEQALIEVANAEILREYPITSLEPYRIDVRKNTKGEYSVEYTLMIGHYRTYESYTVQFDTDKTVKKVYGNYGEYASYLPFATADKIRSAEEKLTQDLEKYDAHSGFYLSVDEGYLCLNAEVIVQAFGNHKHKFFQERICSLQHTSDFPAEPPIFSVSDGKTTISAWRGTYSWMIENENGQSSGITADSMHPLDCKNSIPSIKVYGNTTLSLIFESEPTNITVKKYRVYETDYDAYEKISGITNTIDVKVGNHIYEIIAKWDDPTKSYSGTVYYAFRTEN